MSWHIDHERAGDVAAIRVLTEKAFRAHPYSEGKEADVIDHLRKAGDLALSLVVRQGDALIAQATYSAAILSNDEAGWMVLGPVAIDPPWQGKGIARALLAHGEQIMRDSGAKGIAVLGDPALYARFGFAQRTPLRLEGPLGAYLQVKSFGATIPDALLRFKPAFD